MQILLHFPVPPHKELNTFYWDFNYLQESKEDSFSHYSQRIQWFAVIWISEFLLQLNKMRYKFIQFSFIFTIAQQWRMRLYISQLDFIFPSFFPSLTLFLWLSSHFKLYLTILFCFYFKAKTDFCTFDFWQVSNHKEHLSNTLATA